MSSNPNQQGWFPNLLAWFSFVGLFATGVVGLSVASRSPSPDLAGAAYLLIGGLAFFLVLMLVLRRL